ncbi:unnamed protein product [Diatraea saccharalis]|uniref:FAD-binding 8 domain-containing protein n=1 Tax=Diatraea saccharalis TaxID=40085 RepID=A0A9N9R9I9_9NEOP|nr:unnamed protein product [Diatraea saccharalis]
MQACMEENSMHFSEEQLLDLTGAMIEDADTENRGAITYEALRNQLSKHDGLLENLSIRTVFKLQLCVGVGIDVAPVHHGAARARAQCRAASRPPYLPAQANGVVRSIERRKTSVICVQDTSVVCVIETAKRYPRENIKSKPGLFGLVGGCANPTGVALCVLLAIICACSQPAVRRGGCFEIFYWTHLLYRPFWVLLIFHGPNFWKWFVVPGTIYVVEKILRFAWMRSKRGKTYISSGVLLPSRVTHLEIKRPSHFEFRAGDYVFINVPAIATSEWHPFTISSAPEQTEISPVIRSVSLLTAQRLKNKSASMPDVMTSQKKWQRLNELRNMMRSESENRFDVISMHSARAVAYKSPRNKALAHSFRYMKNKPAIVAFNTPTDTDKDRRKSNESIITQARRRLSKSISPDKDIEKPTITVVSPSTESECTSGSSEIIYPVGKPLEIPDGKNRMIDWQH